MFLSYFSVHFLKLLEFFFHCLSLFCNRHKTSLLSHLAKCKGNYEDPTQGQLCYNTLLPHSIHHIPRRKMRWLWSTGGIISKGNVKHSYIIPHRCCFVYQKSTTEFPGTEPGYPQCEATVWSPELCYLCDKHRPENPK